MHSQITESVSYRVRSILDPLASAGTIAVFSNADPLSEAETSMVQDVPVRILSVEPVKKSKIAELGTFILHYAGVSTAVFAVLLVAANFSAYSSIVTSWVFPESVKASTQSIAGNLEKSRITAYAAEAETAPIAIAEALEEAAVIKQKLTEDHVVVKEEALSPKKLIPAKPQVVVDFDVVPYENRIIIPKIGKNVPLVDVQNGNNFDFDHMENIFMKELEKGVVRYPGTSRPGEPGNSFIFGHSSNYPWMKGEYNQIFAMLDQLSFGDEIIVYYNQKKYVYVIREKKVVKPGDVKVMERDEKKKELSLMTCWPVGTTLKRMIVFAEIKSETDIK